MPQGPFLRKAKISEALSVKAMRRADAGCLSRYGIPTLLLMENAGRIVAEVALRMLGGESGPVGILCGGGNNGGDGLCAARHLHNRGVKVGVFLLKSNLSRETRAQKNMARRMGIKMRRKLDSSFLSRGRLLIDAILGTGTRAPLENDLLKTFERINRLKKPVLAVDIPSGMDADTGQPLGDCIKADVTVALAAPKKGFFAPEGKRHCGKIFVADIGIPRSLLKRKGG